MSRSRKRAGAAARASVVLLACSILPALAFGQVTEREDASTTGGFPQAGAELPQAGSFVSADGRFVCFIGGSHDIVAGDTNAALDVFVLDRFVGTIERVSVDSAGQQANGGSGLFGITMTPDGRSVAFYSEASNLVSGDTNGVPDVFLHDRQTGATERVSVDSQGVQGNARSAYPALTPDARFVLFGGYASNLVAGDSNGAWDLFVRDRSNGTTERISISSTGAQGDADAGWGSLSDDGRFVAFYSSASTLVSGDTNATWDVFVRDRRLGTTELVSTPLGAPEFHLGSWGGSISADGRCVAFVSSATNLVPGDTNGVWDVFVRDLLLGTTERVSVGPGGAQSNGTSFPPSISADGRYVAFASGGTTLVPGITSGGVFVRDRRAGTTEFASFTSTGVQPNGTCDEPSISSQGRYVVFRGSASNLVPNDTNTIDDVFLRDRQATGFTSLCDAGLQNVIACPCANPPSSAGRGCDNSSGTGGAILAASGVAYLSLDSLVFDATGLRPNATGVLLEGDALVPSGAVFGQGVRCAGGSLKRLFVKSAPGGNLHAPDLAGGDPTISARNAALGSPLQAGQPRWFLVYYRDPLVLGGCPATSTFNSTQTGLVSYWP